MTRDPPVIPLCRASPSRAIADRLLALASRVQSNLPSHANPESFHVEKDAIAHEIRQAARALT